LTPDRLSIAVDQLASRLRGIEDPVVREITCRLSIAVVREIRAETLNELHRQLGSWQKVGEATGLPRQDAWRMAKGGR
jgi:hypothetical protein